MDLHAYLLGRISRLPATDHPVRRIDAFRRQFPRVHMVFACHAALPIALTPHLLNMLWVNFQRDGCNTPLKIPWVATADLLLSKLCQQVGGRLYEMHLGVRQELLAALYQDDCYGPRRLFDLAVFVHEYVQPELEGSDPYWRPVAQAQDWNALAYMHPEQAAASIAKELGQSIVKNDYAEQLRLASILETLADPLRGYGGLVEYARLRRGLVQGQAPTAQEAAVASQQAQTVAGQTGDGRLVIPGLENVPLPPVERDLPVEIAGARLETLLTQARLALSQRNFALAQEYAASALELDTGSSQAHLLRKLSIELPARLEALEGVLKPGSFSAYQHGLDEIQALLAQLEPDPQAAGALLANLLGELPSTREAFDRAVSPPAPAPTPAGVTEIDLAALREIPDEHERAEALIKLAPDIPEALLGEALSIARQVEDDVDHARALVALLPRLPEEQRPGVVREAMETVLMIKEGPAYRAALVSLLPYLPAGQQKQVVDQVLKDVGRIKDERLRAEMLASLIPQMPEDQRGPVIREALKATDWIWDEDARAAALVALAPYLSGEYMLDALRAARGINDGSTRVRVLLGYVPRLDESGRLEVVAETLQSVQKFEDPVGRIEAWIALMPYLDDRQRETIVKEALAAAEKLPDEQVRTRLLGELEKYLPGAPAEQVETPIQAAEGEPPVSTEALTAAGELLIRISEQSGGEYWVELDFRRGGSSVLRPRDGKVRFDQEVFREIGYPKSNRYGRLLQKNLFSDPALQKFIENVQSDLRANPYQMLRTRLLLEQDASWLHELYWETLAGPREDALFPNSLTVFSRYVPIESGPDPALQSTSHLRAVVMISNPADLEDIAPVDVDLEAALAQVALRAMGDQIKIYTTDPSQPGHASREYLEIEMNQGTDILYLVCHITRDRDGSSIWLEGQDGHKNPIMASDLAYLIRPQAGDRRPRLVVLKTPARLASKAPEPATNPATAAALQLVRGGIHAVLFFRQEIAAGRLGRFLTRLFKELQMTGQVDLAIARARTDVFWDDNWWAPVLVTSLPDGLLFLPATGTGEMAIPSQEEIAPTWSRRVVPVAITGDDREAVSRLVERVQAGRKESTPFLELAATGETPQIEVLAEVSSQYYRIPSVSTEYPAREVTTPKGTVEDARRAYTLLGRMAFWLNLLRLQNPLTRLPEDAVTLELFIVNPRSGERSLITASERDSNLVEAIFDPVKNPSGVPIQLRLVHTSRVLQPLFCAVYALEDDFDKSIQALFPSGVWLQPGSDAWTDAANPDLIFNLGMRPEPVDHGTGSTHTALKLVVATGEFDPTLLVQAGMEAPVTKTAINQAVQRSLPPTPEGQEDWYTHTVWLEISVTEELAGESQPADVSHEAQAGSPEDDFLYFNGINGETGDYDLPPVSLIDLSEMIQGAQPPGNLDEPRRQEQDE